MVMNKKLRSKFLIGLAILSFSHMLQAKTFRWAFQGDAGTIDPQALYEGMTLGFQGNIYEGLVGRRGDMSLEPLLSVRWENIQPNVWRFYLRKNVVFHNGNTFNADDVVFTAKRIRSEGSALTNLAELYEKIVKVDDYTIDWHTNSPNPILPNQIEEIYILDKQWAEENDTETVARNGKNNYAQHHTNGTGPFMVKERVPGERTILVKNTKWWNTHKSNVTEAIFTPIPDEDARVKALTSNQVDMAYPIHVKYWKRLEFNKEVDVLAGTEVRTIYLGFDHSRDELLYSNIKGKNPIKDLRVRQAFQKAIDLKAIKSRVMRNTSNPTGLMIAPQVNGFSEELNKISVYDPKGAKRLLSEAGYPNGFEITMDCPNDRYVNDEMICQSIVDMLARVGIKVTLLAQTKSKVFKKIFATSNYSTSFYLLGWTPTSLDAHDVLRDLIACRGEGAGRYNLGGYCNMKVDALIKKIQSETNQKIRQSMIEEAFRIHASDVGHIPLHQQPLSWGVRKNVKLIQRADNEFHLKHVVMP